MNRWVGKMVGGFEQSLLQNAGRDTFESLQRAGLDLLCRNCVLFILLCCAFGLFNKSPTALRLPLKLFRDSHTHTQTHTDELTSFITAMSCTEDEPQDHRHMLTNTNTHWVHRGTNTCVWRQGGKVTAQGCFSCAVGRIPITSSTSHRKE